MKKRIQLLAKKYISDMKKDRRYFHQYPELAHQEFLTQAYIEKELDLLQIPHKRSATTGVVAYIRGDYPGKTVLLRADMDALPLTEENDIPFQSKHSGIMHACGHDGHIAGLLGAARILQSIKDQLHGNITLMFQPAEETDGGAKTMIEEGILEHPKVDVAFGLHLHGEVPKGHFEVCYGPMYGSPDEFTITIYGKGGHAASPQQSIDPIMIATQFIQEAQWIWTRKIDPMKPSLVSFCSIHAGEGYNVIPTTCTIQGTLRNLYPETRIQTHQLLEETLAHLCTLHHANYQFDFMSSYPPLINDEQTTQFVEQTLQSYFSKEEVHRTPFPSLGAEDFAYLCKTVPSCYYHVGIKEENQEEPIFHHPEFHWNDDVLEHTSSSFVFLTYEYLNKKEQ